MDETLPDPGAVRRLAERAEALRGELRFAEAEELYRELLPLRQSLHGDQHPEVGAVHLALAACRFSRGDPEGGRRHLVEAADRLRLHPGHEEEALSAYLKVASVRWLEGDEEGAAELARRALAMGERLPADPGAAEQLRGYLGD